MIFGPLGSTGGGWKFSNCTGKINKRDPDPDRI